MQLYNTVNIYAFSAFTEFRLSPNHLVVNFYHFRTSACFLFVFFFFLVKARYLARRGDHFFCEHPAKHRKQRVRGAMIFFFLLWEITLQVVENTGSAAQ